MASTRGPGRRTGAARQGPVTRAPREAAPAPVPAPAPATPESVAPQAIGETPEDDREFDVAMAEEGLRAAPPIDPPAADDPEMEENDPAGGVDIPLDPGEHIIAEATRLEPDGLTADQVPITYIVTSAGRKIGIDPDGWIAVLSGPALDIETPRAPTPPRASWKEPRG